MFKKNHLNNLSTPRVIPPDSKNIIMQKSINKREKYLYSNHN